MARSEWRRLTSCSGCPFRSSGKGLAIRRGLRPGRWRGILADLRRGAHFFCHETVGEDVEHPGPKARLCTGALDWQAARGLSSNYQRICERLDELTATRPPHHVEVVVADDLVDKPDLQGVPSTAISSDTGVDLGTNEDFRQPVASIALRGTEGT